MKKLSSTIMLGVFLLLLNGCDNNKKLGQKNTLKESKKTSIDNKKKEVNNIELENIKEISLDAKGKGFIYKLRKLQYRGRHFYGVGSISPEINVFDSTGRYLKSIMVTPPPKGGCSFSNFTISNDGKNFFMKDIQRSIIYKLNYDGKIESKISTVKPVQLGVGGVEVVETTSGLVLFSTVFQWMDDYSKILTDNLMIGLFRENYSDVKLFAKHDPLTVEYNLMHFQKSTFTIFRDEIYLLEAGLPYVRVFSLNGELKRKFGEPGVHQRPLKKEKEGRFSPAEITSQAMNATFFEEIKVVENIVGYGSPAIAVCYVNPTFVSKQTREYKANYFLMLYSLGGELLASDVKLPGMLMDVDDFSNLIIEKDKRPDSRIMGFYKLHLIKSDS